MRVKEFLKANPNKRFSDKQIAEAILAEDQDYRVLRENAHSNTKKTLVAQVASEISSRKDNISIIGENIFRQSKPSPRVHWYNPNETWAGEETKAKMVESQCENKIKPTTNHSISEQELYPLLIEYLKSELNLYCQRIDEKRSKNSYGSGGNQWLHPDIVAMQPIDKGWNSLIRNCVKQGAGQSVRLWSFEVKKELNRANARKSFFQAVSNSSWANEGYLVATAISDSKVKRELRMLSSLHGIGIIILNPYSPSESAIILPAKSRSEVDWQSVNRILEENVDFKDYIELVSTYYQTGRVRAIDWNKT